MRRIYDSDALQRSDDPHAPAEREQPHGPQSFRSVNAGWLSRGLVPAWLRHRVVSVEVTTRRSTFAVDEPVVFYVEMHNPMPFPVTIATQSPVAWTWRVDGATEASRVPVRDPPAESWGFHFDRGERKRFRKVWRQRFRISGSEWEPAEPGEHVVGAGINVEDPEAAGLSDEATVRIVEA